MREILCAAVVGVVSGIVGVVHAASPLPTLAPIPTITALPLNAPPVNGFVPRVVFGLTSEQQPNDQTFSSHPSSTPGGTKYPASGGPKYFVATLDSGSQSHIVTYDDAQALHLAGPPSREGNYQSQIAGASGVESADISDPLGVYATGLGNATGGSAISVTPGTLRGQTNTAILTTEAGSSLPNIIGAPMIAQYQTVIRTSVPRAITVGATTYRSPDISFQALNTPLPSNYSRLTFDVMSPSGVAPDPVFIPSFDNFNNFADNPTTPSFWMSLFGKTTVSGGGGSTTDQFLFDTGAQITVLSQDSAAECGFYSAGENPSTPDFTVQVSGVGGVQEVPGFYLDTLKVTTNGGPMTWHHVPVLVLDLIDPRDGVGFVPGILGMNLFTDRDLILNGGLTDPSVGISPQQQWLTNSSGNWSDGAKWFSNYVPNVVDAPANFLGKITSPQTINLNGNFTVGSINFDNANRYTIAGSGAITLQSEEGAAGITVANGSHTISAPMTLASDTAIWVLPPTSKLSITGNVNAAGKIITMGGNGTAEMKNIRAAELDVTSGTFAIAQAGNAASVSVLSAVSTKGSGRFDLKNNNLIVKAGDVGSWDGEQYTGITGLIASGRGDGTWNGGGIVTSMSAATNGVLTTLAISTADHVGVANSNWSGQLVASDDVLVMYTWGGDSNLDGQLNGDDYFAIDSHILQSGSVFGYDKGDFNYDGVINGDDYFVIDANITFAQGSAAFYNGEGVDLSAVPEPFGLCALLAALPLLRRRRVQSR